MRCAAHWLTLTLLLLPGVARADDPRLFGYVKSYLFQRLAAPDYPIDRAGARVQIGVEGGGAKAAYHLALNVDLGYRSDELGERSDSPLRIDPVEAYFEILGERLELRVGRQLIFWGRTVWESPTDVLTGWDYGRISGEVEDYRLAPTAARLRWLLSGELELDLVWIPIFRPSRLPVPVPDLGGAGRVVVLPDARPPRDLLHGEVGLRLTHTISAWALDWSLAAYHGYDKAPVYELRPLAPPTDPRVLPTFVWQARYERMDLLGLDFAKALGPFVLTGEVALALGEDSKGEDPTRENHRVESVLGLTWTVSQDLEVGLQGNARVLLSYDRSAEREALRALRGGEAPAFVPARADGQAQLYLRAGLSSEVEAQVVLIYDATYQDGFSVAFLTCRPMDSLLVTAGVVAFAGREETTPFGRARGASQAFVEAKMVF